jgi:hypothetical protein
VSIEMSVVSHTAARWELDTGKLLTLLHATEAAMLIRWQALEECPHIAKNVTRWKL